MQSFLQKRTWRYHRRRRNPKPVFLKGKKRMAKTPTIEISVKKGIFAQTIKRQNTTNFHKISKIMIT